MIHKLHMRFERCQGWRVSFRDLADGRAQFREFTFADAGKVEALVDRTATKMVLEDRSAFEFGPNKWSRRGQPDGYRRAVPKAFAIKAKLLFAM